MLFNMWYCPFPIATFLTGGTAGSIVLMLIIFVLSGLIWMPFFKAYDKQLVHSETTDTKSDSDEDWSF